MRYMLRTAQRTLEVWRDVDGEIVVAINGRCVVPSANEARTIASVLTQLADEKDADALRAAQHNLDLEQTHGHAV